jgi:hypothetical protein
MQQQEEGIPMSESKSQSNLFKILIVEFIGMLGFAGFLYQWIFLKMEISSPGIIGALAVFVGMNLITFKMVRGFTNNT